MKNNSKNKLFDMMKNQKIGKIKIAYIIGYQNNSGRYDLQSQIQYKKD